MSTLRSRFASEGEKFFKFLDESASKTLKGHEKKSGDRSINFEQVTALTAKAGPFFLFLGNILQYVEPVARTAYSYGEQLWIAAQPYHPEDLCYAVYGLCLTFFGGIFMTLVAAVEAVHLFGWTKIKVAFTCLYKEWSAAAKAFKRDNKVDKDRDGIADVDQLSAQQLAARRAMVLTKAIDPESVAFAMEGLTTASVAIVATLRVRFAKAITLGTAIGEVLTKLMGPFAANLLEALIPRDYEKWIPVLIRYGFRYVGVSLSWMLMRVTTGMFASIRGSSLFITGLCGYLVRYGYVSKNVFNEGNPAIVAAWGILAFAGWSWQMSSGFSLSFPLNILLLPFTVAEHLTIWAVGVAE